MKQYKPVYRAGPDGTQVRMVESTKGKWVQYKDAMVQDLALATVVKQIEELEHSIKNNIPKSAILTVLYRIKKTALKRN